MSFVDYLVKTLLTKERMSRMGVREETQEDLDQHLPIIEFFCESNIRPFVMEPVPAMKKIATWWKKIPADLPAEGGIPRDHFGSPVMTAKRCIPLLDGMSLGYVMRLAVDVHVRTNDKGNLMDVQSGPSWNGASKHDVIQFGGDRGRQAPTFPTPAIKFHNPWVIKTRPGYSTLFIPPVNHVEEKRFQCLGAVVDTDTYAKQVNFPALWLGGNNYDGLIPAGTPLVTAIPFKRSDVSPEMIIRNMQPHERILIDEMGRAQNARSHVYTEELREARK